MFLYITDIRKICHASFITALVDSTCLYWSQLGKHISLTKSQNRVCPRLNRRTYTVFTLSQRYTILCVVTVINQGKKIIFSLDKYIAAGLNVQLDGSCLEWMFYFYNKWSIVNLDTLCIWVENGDTVAVVKAACFESRRSRVRTPLCPQSFKGAQFPRWFAKIQYCGQPPWQRGSVLSLRPAGSNFESRVWRAVSPHSSHHPQDVLLSQFGLYVHKGGLKPHSFHFDTIHLSWALN